MTKSNCSVTDSAKPKQDWHNAFLEMVPAIRKHVRFCFRHLHPEAKEEVLQEVVANALVAYRRLVDLGKTDLAYPSALARYGVAHYRVGRRVSTRMNSEDVTSAYAQCRQGFRIARLDRYDRQEQAWQEILVEDKRATPADLAASRIDFAAWLHSLAPRHRRIAQLLATRESTSTVAGRFHISPGRVSQIRHELHMLWEEFMADKATPAAA